ncbi:MAG: hypothetical protein HGB03_03370 [Candidatus Yonathbacteria bacterium]|nr:hypothetical protein [Candidatus Yonathbacteria bacterium]NTW47332.1 hypothetical protein [Candidatus Yonathbacteria bacterium]
MHSKEIINKIHDIAKGITNVKDIYVSEKNLILDYVTIFAHSESELTNLVNASNDIGQQIDEHNGPIYKLNQPIVFYNGVLNFFRIRKPDPERPQTGCGDFKVADYDSFKHKYLGVKNFELFHGDEFEFLGIHDMSQDYLVYFPDIVISEDLKNKPTV